MNFKTQLISNPKFFKYRVLRDIIAGILLVVSVPAIYMNSNSSNRKSSREELSQNHYVLYYFCFVLLLFFIYYLFNYFITKTEKVGSLEISHDRIKIEKDNEIFNYKISTLEKVEIERGSTFHHDGLDRKNNENESYTGDNWIIIHEKNKTVIKYEFEIRDTNHNEEFEKMIFPLRRKYMGKVVYRSI